MTTGDTMMPTLSDDTNESTKQNCEIENNDTPITETTISLAEMDQAIAELKTKREEYKAAKAISDGLELEKRQLEARVVEMLEQAGKTVYVAEGVGRVKVSYEMSVQTPKTPEEKKAFFNWLATNMGQDVADAYLTVNSVSLNSLYNQLNEQAAQKGEVLSIDGLGEPIARTKLSLTKA